MQRTIDGITISAIASGREYTRVPEFWFESMRHTPLSRGALILPDPIGEEIQRVKKGDEVTIVMAYRGEPASYWQAEVTWIKLGTDHQIALGLVAMDYILSKAKFTESFMHESPEAILQRLLGQAGLKIGRIDSPGCELPRFMVSNENIWQIAEKLEFSCTRSFDLDMSRWALWMDDSGLVSWGDFDAPDQAEIPSIITGQNLIRHLPATDLASFSMVETFLLPSLRHSHVFKIKDMYRNISGAFRAEKVRTEGTGSKARTFIWYGPERKKY